ncbi:hypothetical protein FOXYS1_2753 [Fusarium oxysporum]|uniref:Major facilitator superfamily (MFS) profile domain-containing protein n=1 Tax=Fusarium oxysporum TaxID=5507 RepID=A0A8H5AKP2_FUSOX|nr:hypothetical protein FOXYS1_2753 [Fusarium oxysporum]
MMQTDTKSACLALVFLGLMTVGDSVTDSLLPALADDAHTQSGRWNLGTAALVLKSVSGQFVIGYSLNTKPKHHAMNINVTSILVASLVTLLSLFYDQQWPVLVAIVGPLAPPQYRFASYYWTGSVSVLAQALGPFFASILADHSHVLPGADALWLLRSAMSVLIFGIILPGIALGTAPRVSYPNNMNLRVARISVLFISAGAFMIGLSGSLRAITIALVINTLGVATDLSLLAFASCNFSSSDAGTVIMTLASIESAGTLLGIGVLYPIYQWSINEDLPFLAGGVPYYICGSLYAVTAVVVWSLRTRRQAPDS